MYTRPGEFCSGTNLHNCAWGSPLYPEGAAQTFVLHPQISYVILKPKLSIVEKAFPVDVVLWEGGGDNELPDTQEGNPVM